MGFAFVVVKEHTRRTVHLRHDNALGAVHNEGTVWRHQRHVAHEHVLFFDVFNRASAGIFVDIEYDQTQCNLQRCAVGQVALHTFFNVEFRLLQLVFYEL